MKPSVTFDGVWKKFERGERQDSLRDLVPAMVKRALRPAPAGGLTRSEFWALRDVSFAVEPGDALGIIGPNGAGKSTALKLLTRILRPTKGSCEVRGRAGALIEIAAGFHPDLTGRENTYLQGAILGMKRAEINGKFDAIVEFAGLSEFIDTPVKRYSSGMNARLGFAIAAHVDPDVLLIDEVLAVGDLGFQQRCLERLREFRKRGVAIVFVSHNLQAVASLCERALLLRQGQSPLLDSVENVIAAYLSAGAIGADDRAAVESVRLSRAFDSHALTGTVSPGDGLRLEFSAAVHADLPRCAVELHVLRHDGLYVFDGVSFTDNGPVIDARAGSTIRCRIDFRANVLRGVYRVGINLVNPDKHWRAVEFPALASFAVEETTRWGGCAELEPRYQLSAVTGMAAPEPDRVNLALQCTT